jgi:hypothetical protein
MNDLLKQQQMAFDLEKERLDLEKERAILQSDIAKQRAEAERDLLKAQLDQRLLASVHPSKIKRQHDILTKIFSILELKPFENTKKADTNAGYIAELVGYHALKRASSEISRGLSGTVGLGNDVRILIVDQLAYAQGDLPLIEVTSQFSVFEVRCRKQVATNKELSEMALPKEESEDEQKPTLIKTGTTRLSLLKTGSGFFPTGSITSADMINSTGLADNAAGNDNDFIAPSPDDREYSLKTNSLIAAVAGSLRSEKRKVYIYNFYSMDTVGPQSKLMNMYAALIDCSGRLIQSRNRLLYFVSKNTKRHTELSQQTKKIETQTPFTSETEQDAESVNRGIGEVAGWHDRAQSAILASEAIHTEIGTFIKTITSEDNTGSGSTLAKAVFREKVRELGITHLLYLNVVSSGGEAVTQKLLWGSGNTSCFGGAVVSYVLSRIEGDVLASDTLPLLYTIEFDPSGQRNSPLRQIRFDKPEAKK